MPFASAVGASLVMSGALWANPSISAAAGTSNKITITYWTWNPGASAVQAMVKAFEQQNPDIIVKASNFTYNNYLVALKTAAEGGQLPTAFGLQVGGMVAQYERYLLPLNSLAESAWGAHWTKKFVPFGLYSVQVSNQPGDHSYYALPQSVQSTSIWYNKAIFQKLHLAVPTSFPQLISEAKVFNAHHIPEMLLGGADGWQNEDLFLQIADQTAPGQFYKIEAANGKESFVTPGLVKAMDIWKEMFTAGVFQKGAMGEHAYPNAVNDFNDGKGAMIPLGSWNLGELLPNLKPPIPLAKYFGAELFPQIPGAAKAVALGGVDVCSGIDKNATPAEQRAAWKFLASLTQGAGENVYANTLSDLPGKAGLIPSVFRQAYPNALPLFKQSVNWMTDSTFRYVTNPNLNTALINALAAVATGQQTAQSALEALNQGFQQP